MPCHKRLYLLALIAALLCFSTTAGIAVAGEPAPEEEPKTPEEVPKTPEEESPREIELPPIDVTAKPPAKPNVGEISEEDMEKPRIGFSAEGLLQNLPGIDLTRHSFSGGSSRLLKLRGFDESRLQIQLDGRPLRGSGVYGGYYVDWSMLLLEDIEKIEVVRGTRSAKYGNTLGGTINFITKKYTFKPNFKAGAESSSFKTLKEYARGGIGIKPTVFGFGAGICTTEGYLRNNDATRRALAAKFGIIYDNKSSLRLRFWRVTGDTGFIQYNRPDSPYYDSDFPEHDGTQLGGPFVAFAGGNLDWGERTYWHDVRDQADFAWEHFFGDLSVKNQFWVNDQERREYFYSISEPNKIVLERFSKPERDTFGFRHDWTYETKKHKTEFGIDGLFMSHGPGKNKVLDSSYFKRQPTDSGISRKPITRRGIYLQERWSAADWVDLHLGMRYDENFIRYREVVFRPGPAGGDEYVEVLESHKFGSPKAGMEFYPWKSGTVGVFASKAYRFPTIPESYWHMAGYQPAGRRRLSPEDAEQFELEAEHAWDNKTKISLCAYYYQIDDYISTIFGYKPSRVVSNIDEAQIGGIELAGQAEFKNCFRIKGNYTHQLSRRDGDILDLSESLSRKLDHLPAHKVNFGAEYLFTDSISTGLMYRFRSQRQEIVGSRALPNAAELKRLHKYAAFDIFFEWEFTKDENISKKSANGKKKNEPVGKLSFSIENLFDRDYEERYGYPMPGRTFTFSFMIKF